MYDRQFHIVKRERYFKPIFLTVVCKLNKMKKSITILILATTGYFPVSKADYGLAVKSFLDNGIHKSSSLNYSSKRIKWFLCRNSI